MSQSSVLIIEDEETLRNLYNEALSLAGLTVFVAADGQAGLDIARREHPSVILVDIMMPGMDGHEVVRLLRADDWGRTAKVIYLTNMSDAANVVEGVASGSVDYIIKSSVTPKEMVNQVRLAMTAS